jgi:hypothetical protein
MSAERTESPRRLALRALVGSRLLILAAGVLGVLEIGVAPGTAGFDPARLTQPFGYFGNLLAAPFARWDSTWYLEIAHSGYSPDRLRTAFFPVYPLAIRIVGAITGSPLIAGVLISLACFLVALVLLHQLAELEIGPERARLTVLLIAFCPVAYYFSAVYTESMFLALSVGAFLAARTERWALAGVLGFVAAAARNSGAVLVVPLLLMYLYGPRGASAVPTVRTALRRSTGRVGGRVWLRVRPRYPIKPDILYIALVPLGLLAFVAFLGITTGDGLAPFHVQSSWYHHFAGPFGGVWDGLVAAWDGVRQLLHGPPPPVYFAKAGGDPLQVGGQNVMLLGFLIAGAWLCWLALRRLPIAYGAYALLALALPLSEPVTPQPLDSLPRYEVVLFPLFMAAATVVAKRRNAERVLACSAVLLGVFTVEFATWRFVS